jgi:predicted Zn-dependent peptidase
VLRGFAAGGTLGLRADFLPQHLGRGLALVADCVAHPASPSGRSTPSSARCRRAARGRARRRRPGARGAALVRETLWPDAARRADADAPQALGRFALLERYRRRYPMSRLIVAVVGNVDPAAVAVELAAAFPGSDATRPAPVRAAPPPPAQLPRPPRPAGEAQPQSQPQPTTAFRANRAPNPPPSSATRPSPRAIRTAPRSSCWRRSWAARAVASGPRSPMSARSLPRERARRRRRRAGYLAVSVTCPPARLDAAVSAVRAELARVASAGVTPDEVNRAARRVIGARAAALRTRMAVADALVRDEAAVSRCWRTAARPPRSRA